MRRRQGAPDGITMTGNGRTSAAVDRVGIIVGVQVLRPDAGEAFRTAAVTVTNLLSVLADNGVDARSVRTAELSLGPRTDYRGGEDVLLGYQASQRLSVQLDDLGSVERILSDVVTRGGVGVRIDQVSLTARDRQASLRAARDAAFADATAKAEHYAGLAGRALGAVQRISEPEFAGAVPLAGFARTPENASANSMAMAFGDTEVTASVQVRWSFADQRDVRAV
jgi:uncharacterized protein YggE